MTVVKVLGKQFERKQQPKNVRRKRRKNKKIYGVIINDTLSMPRLE